MRNEIFGPLFEKEISRYIASNQVTKLAAEALSQYCDELFNDPELNQLIDSSLEPIISKPNEYYGVFEDHTSVPRYIADHSEQLSVHPVALQFSGSRDAVTETTLNNLFQLRLINRMLNEQGTLFPFQNIISSGDVAINISTQCKGFQCAISIDNGGGGGPEAQLLTGVWGDELLSSPIKLSENTHHELIRAFQRVTELAADPSGPSLKLPIRNEPINWSLQPLEIYESICSTISASLYVKEHLLAITEEVRTSSVEALSLPAVGNINHRLFNNLDDKLRVQIARKIRTNSYLQNYQLADLLPALEDLVKGYSKGFAPSFFGDLAKEMLNQYLEEHHHPHPSGKSFPLSQPLLSDLVTIDQYDDRGHFMKEGINALQEHWDNVQSYKASLDLAESLEGLASPEINEPLIQANAQTVDIDTIPIKGAM